jgi:hypothetical protein
MPAITAPVVGDIVSVLSLLLTELAKVPGRSAATSERNVGVAADPETGPAKTLLADCVDSVIAIVPAPVTGLPLAERSAEGTVTPTLVTVPGVDEMPRFAKQPATVVAPHPPYATGRPPGKYPSLFDHITCHSKAFGV